MYEFTDFYALKNNLKLNDFEENKIFSSDMIKFYKTIMDSIERIENEIIFEKHNNLHNFNTIETFLNYKSLRNEFSLYKEYLNSNPNATSTEIKSFFRKIKIEKILNE